MFSKYFLLHIHDGYEKIGVYDGMNSWGLSGENAAMYSSRDLQCHNHLHPKFDAGSSFRAVGVQGPCCCSGTCGIKTSPLLL